MTHTLRIQLTEGTIVPPEYAAELQEIVQCRLKELGNRHGRISVRAAVINSNILSMITELAQRTATEDREYVVQLLENLTSELVNLTMLNPSVSKASMLSATRDVDAVAADTALALESQSSAADTIKDVLARAAG